MKYLAPLILLVFFITSCAGHSGISVAPAREPTAEEVAALVRTNGAFSLAAARELSRARPGNWVFSPLVILDAFSMAFAGARGETEDQMIDVFRFTLPQSRLHQVFHALDATLDAAADSAASQHAVTLVTANSLWAQSGYDLKPEFIQTLEREYDLSIQVLDFETKSEEARRIINEWVAAKTGGRINDLLSSLGSGTRVVLTSAAWFEAKWEYPFDPSVTGPRSFHLLEGRITKPQFMSVEAGIPWFEDNDVVAVELPYSDDTWSMIILMPSPGTYEHYLNQWSWEALEKINSELEFSAMFPDTVVLRVPRFEQHSRQDLVNLLGRMGMELPFDRTRADFSGMASPRLWEDQLYITQAVQEAAIEVREEGTKATAAAAVVGGVRGGLPPEPSVFSHEIVIDHPFLYIVQHRPTGTILFMGSVVDPAPVR